MRWSGFRMAAAVRFSAALLAVASLFQASGASAQTKLKELQAFTGTLTFETDTGMVYTLIEAFCSNPPKLEKGEVSLEFGAVECLEG